MKASKKRRLEATGWKVGTAQEFLGLNDEEAAFVELKVALARALRARRARLGFSQAKLAERLGSSQSRVAKMENVDASVSVDLLVRAFYALGATARDLAAAIAQAKAPRSVRPRVRRATG